MIQYGRGFLPIVSQEGTLQSVVFKKDLDRHILHPEASVDDRTMSILVKGMRFKPEGGDYGGKRLPGGRQSMLNSPYQFRRKVSLSGMPENFIVADDRYKLG